MKINWKRNHRIILDGYVGDVLCFYLHLDPVKTKNGPCILICDLPQASKNHYGRLTTKHKTPKEAAKAAELTLQLWVKRFRR